MSGSKSQIVKLSPIETWPQAEGAMAHLAVAAAERRALQADMDEEIGRLRAAHEEDLQKFEARVEELEKALAKFAKAHKREFKPREAGGDTRSFEHAGVLIGFRTTPPQVRIENEEKAIDWLTHWAGGAYVRTKVEPDRQGLADILKDDSDAAVEKLAAHGITLQQRDKFFCEVKAED